MNAQEVLSKMKLAQCKIQEFLENEDNADEYFLNLNIFLNESKICDNHQLKTLLRLILNISNYHLRGPNFFIKLEKILNIFKEEIQKNYSNSGIFNIFKSNKRLLLYLIEEKIIKFDKYIVTMITNDKYKESSYHLYFKPELKPFVDEEWFPKDLKNQILEEELPSDFFEKRLIGENDDYICKLIQEDSIKEFIVYINKTNYSLDNSIKKSIYETNLFLLKNTKNMKLIEYAAFYGSIQIFKYLFNNKIENLFPSIWIYAIHGSNAEIIHLLENYHIEPEDKTYKRCFFESIKFHFNETSYFLYYNYLQNEESNIIDSNEFINWCLKYYNFEFIQDDLSNELSFYYLCKYDYFLFVKLYLQSKNIDVNKFEIINEKEYKKSISYCNTPFYIAVKKSNFDIVNLLLTIDSLDVNKVCTKKVTDNAYNRNINKIYEKSALYCAVENNNLELTKLLLSNDKIDTNISFSYEDEIKSQTLYFKSLKSRKAILNTAILNKNVELVDLLLSSGKIDVNSIDEYKRYNTKSALYIAVENENIEIIKLLLKNDKIDVNFGYENHFVCEKTNKTALFAAIEKENIEIIKLLLQNNGIDVNFINKEISFIDKKIKLVSSKTISYTEKTVFYLAVEKGNIEIIKLLLLIDNIDINIRCKLKTFSSPNYDMEYLRITPFKDRCV